ncbi:hypothetical protein HK096_005652, partial [Nowakowskiella sp. JEL0078]
MERLLQGGSQVVYPDLETILSLSSQTSLSAAALLNTKKKLLQTQNNLHINLVDDSDSAIHKNRQQSSLAARNSYSSVMPTIPVSDLAAALISAREDDDERLLPSGKKKPGRKPSNIEPTNKRTAQNRAAQRAFRERRERYVKDLEIRVQQLESISSGVESTETSLNLLRENLQLKQKIQELETHNSSLKNMSFNLEFPLLEKAVASNMPLLFPTDHTTANTENINMNFTPPEQRNNLYLSDTSTFDLSPYQTEAQNFIPTESDKNLFKDIFGNLPTPSPSTTTVSPMAQHNIEFQQPTNIFAPSLLNSGAKTTADTNNQLLSNLLLDLTSPSFTQLQDSQTPYSLVFDQTPQNLFMDDWLDLVPKTEFFSGPVEKIEDAKKNAIEGNALVELCDDDKLRDRVIEFVDDESALEELCQLFRTKATCSDVQDIQRKMVDACKRNDKDGFMDLVTTCKEQKRMYK